MQLSWNNWLYAQTRTKANKKKQQNVTKHNTDFLDFPLLKVSFLAVTIEAFYSVKDLVWPSFPVFSSGEKRGYKVTVGDSWVQCPIRIPIVTTQATEHRGNYF